MSEVEGSVRGIPQQQDGDSGLPPGARDEIREIGFADIVNLLSRRWVSVAAVIMIIVQLAWKADFLSHFYFRQDDIHFTEIALRSTLGWKYLSYVGSGHLHPGVLLIVWIMSRAALYSWGPAAAVLLVMLAVASFAAWRLLRLLLGDRPAILIPLAIYLVTPLTFPNDSWWQSGIESAPLQAVIFLSLIAHIRYVRTGAARQLVLAAAWLAVGLFFFEKAAVIPVILFAVTTGFLLDGPISVTVRQTAARYWRAWLTYVAMVAVYGAVLLVALRSSTVKPAAGSTADTLAFSGNLIKDTLLPGLLGGPWRWYFVPGNAVGYSAPPTQLIWLSLFVVAGLIVASVRTRTLAWRAWAILAVWIVLADIVPVIFGRLTNLGKFTWVFELDTRYVADAAPVAAICVALAFWPVARAARKKNAAPPGPGEPDYFTSQTWRVAGLCLTGAIVIGSLVSVSNYESVTAKADTAGKTYLANARASLAADLPPGTVILDEGMPPNLMAAGFYLSDGLESAALGPMATTATARAVRWTQHPSGTIDNLAMFGTDGTLDRAVIAGARSVPEPGGAPCWRFRRHTAVIRFGSASPASTGLVRVGYYADAAASGRKVTVSYGGVVRQFVVQVGLHGVYLPVSGTASSVTVVVPATGAVCVGDVEAGNLAPGFPLVARAQGG
jgi:hypothetical protein